MLNAKLKVYIGADHGGYKLKEELKLFLEELGHEVEDLGAFELNPEDDYPDFVVPVGHRVVGGIRAMGVVIGRSGNGEAIVANKIRGIRAALCVNSEMARKAREHNDANVLSLGADFITHEEGKEIVKTFLETDFSGDLRHVRRLDKINKLEQ